MIKPERFVLKAKTANNVKTIKVIASWITFNWKGERAPLSLKPIRLAGMKKYEQQSQLIKLLIRRDSNHLYSLNLRWP